MSRPVCPPGGCGRCCDPVVLPFTQEDAARQLPGTMDPENRRFVMQDLTRIPRRIGLPKVIDYMPGGARTVGSVEKYSEPVIIDSFFYECRWYDKETRLCNNFENRPPLCRGFPWYEAGPDRTKAIPLECVFNVDIGRPVKVAIRGQ